MNNLEQAADPIRSTESKTTDPEFIHFFGPLTIVLPGPAFASGRVMRFGEEIATKNLRAVNEDRTGWCFLDIVSDPEAQEARYGGRQVFAPGKWPEGESRTEAGSEEWWREYEVARSEAFGLKDEAEQAQRLSLIAQVYGRPTTSKTLRNYTNPNDRPSW